MFARNRDAFTVLELLAAIGIVVVLGTVLVGAGWKVYESSSLAVSANNIRQLAAGGQAYLTDHKYTFWKYREAAPPERQGTIWWWGYETVASAEHTEEGRRKFDPGGGPLSGYVSGGFRADPSFALNGGAFKPKYQSGYLGVGYNILLGGGWEGKEEKLKRFWDLTDPSQVVVFITSAQVNTFQSPASAKNPMIEEFYAVDEREVTVHFRHHGNAMVSFANGSAGFLPMDESTRDKRMPKANVGRLAPKNSKKYLE